MLLETLGGSLLGGLFRMAPEVLKTFDRKNERKHELAMTQQEMEFAKVKGEIAMRQVEAAMSMAELDAMSAAITEQGQTARSAGWFVAAISALVRPLVTYWFVGLYSMVKIAAMTKAFRDDGNWQDVLISHWTQDDMAMLMMVLTFWFVGRSIEKRRY